MEQNNDIVIEVKVPVQVDEASRPAFQKATVDFLFGADRVRPEFAAALREEGVDIAHLHRLSAIEHVGACVVPTAREFIPDEKLTEYCSGRGISLTEGGRVRVAFDYEGASAETTHHLDIGLSHGGEALPADLHGSVVHALFGDCGLAPAAQKYLRANGVDIVRFAHARASLLPSADTPMTTRVDPDTEGLLKRFGLQTDKFGKLNVISSKSLAIDAVEDNSVGWSKATCC